MSPTSDYSKRPTSQDESRGYDGAYEEARDKARKELAATMPGPRAEGPSSDDTGIKNPDGEFQNPAPMAGAYQAQGEPGPNAVGNSRGDGTVDPQGQQGGTHGGQPGTADVAVGDRKPGTVLADPQARIDQSSQRRGPGADSGA